MQYDRITKCRVCGSNRLETVVDLGVQSLSGQFPLIGKPDPLYAPLKLVQCQGDCGLVQLGHHMPLDKMYNKGYGYLSGLNQSMKKHLEDIAVEAESLVSLQKGDAVLDIGSNDATLLKAYTIEGLFRIGVDPGGEAFQSYYPKGDGWLYIPDFFKGDHILFKPKIITSIAMFYDLEDPNGFVADIKRILHPDGVWIVEQLYLPEMMENTAFDAICHEHLEYYGVRQMLYLLRRHGLRPFKIEFNETNGNSFRLYVCHEKADREVITGSLLILGEAERMDFKGFNVRMHRYKEALVGFLVREKAKGRTVHLYGASTKVNVLLQYMGIDYRLVSFAADRNPRKHGCWTPGTHIPIYSEEFSRGCCPDFYLVGPWHFHDVFIKQLQGYLDAGGQLIFPLPEPVVVGKDGVRRL